MKRIRRSRKIRDAMLVVLSMLFLQIQPAFAADRNVIVSFPDAGENIQEINVDMDASENEVIQRLPSHIIATLDSGEEVSVEVSWSCAGEFDSGDYYYEFIPSVQDDSYAINESAKVRDAVPYALVVRTENETKVNASQSADYNVSSNIETIFSFLTKNCGFNTAAACGVLANIECESNFNPNIWGDNDTSYGICQWHAGRLTAMQEWCDDNGYNWKTLTGQLNYLKKELSANDSKFLHNGKVISDYMKGKIKNSADGAYQAGYYWCTNYEVPADTENQSISRGNRAKTTYWSMFANGAEKTNVVYTTGNLNVRSTANTDGNVLGTITKGSSVSIKSYSAGWYQITYNGKNGYICAEYTTTIPNGTSVTSQFSDIKGTEWYLPAVQYMFDTGIMTGTGNSKFSPNAVCTRASVATMTSNLSDYSEEFKLNEKTRKISFSDVSTKAWHYTPIRWALSNGIMSGYGGTNKFGPNDRATREQLVTVLYQYAGKIGKETAPSGSLSKYSDASSVSSYAKNAMKWAISQKIIQGDGKGHLNSKKNVTRAEAASMMQHFIQME